jgi:hypothetical protein
MRNNWPYGTKEKFQSRNADKPEMYMDLCLPFKLIPFFLLPSSTALFLLHHPLFDFFILTRMQTRVTITVLLALLFSIPTFAAPVGKLSVQRPFNFTSSYSFNSG